jgi:hypothetical protein
MRIVAGTESLELKVDADINTEGTPFLGGFFYFYFTRHN